MESITCLPACPWCRRGFRSWPLARITGRIARSHRGPGGVGKRSGDDMMPPLPTNLEAERAILGTVLRDNAQLAKVREILRPEDFSSIENAFLFRTMLRFADTGNPIDLITLTDFLEAQKEIGKVGGKAYIASLCDGLYRISNVEKYARIVKDKSVKRSVIHATELVQLHAFDGKTPEDVLRTLKAQVEAIERSLPQSPTAATNNIKIWTLQQFLVEEFPPREPLVVIKNSETPVFTARS